MKRNLLGISFVLAGIGFLSFPEPDVVFYYFGTISIFIGLIISIVGTVKKDR